MRKFLASAGQSAGGAQWVSDSSVVTCQLCGAPFTVTRRRHHCRLCGGVFCASCSQGRMEVAGYSAPQRVCVACSEAPPQRPLVSFIVDRLPQGGETVAWRRSASLSDKVPEREAAYVARGARVRGEDLGDFIRCQNGLYLPREFVSLEPASPASTASPAGRKAAPPTSTAGSPLTEPASTSSPLARLGRALRRGSAASAGSGPRRGSRGSEGSSSSASGSPVSGQLGGSFPAYPPELDEEELRDRERRRQEAMARRMAALRRREQEDAVWSRLRPLLRDTQRRRLLQLVLSSRDLPRGLALRRVDLAVAACSWCTYDKKPTKAGPLRRWLQIGRDVDVVAVGLQEVSAKHAERWIDYLNHHLLAEGFRVVATRHLGSLLIAVYVSELLQPHVHNVASQKQKPGGMFSGGHGAVSVRFTLMSKRFLFVNAHMPPAADTPEKRNEQYLSALDSVDVTRPEQPCEHPITNLVEFGGSGDAGEAAAGPPRATRGSIAASAIGRHDYCLLFGDLNYRLTGEYDEIIEAIAHRRYGWLIQSKDELTRARKEGSAFAVFREAEVRFPPTYKYVPKQDTYDTSRKGGKQRLPSYVDRALFAAVPGGVRSEEWLPLESNQAAPIKYKAYREGNKRSDHRPITLLLGCACYDPDPAVLERIADLGLSGMRPSEVAEKLREEFPGRLEEKIYRRVQVPCDDERGPGTYYSSEDDQETAAVRQQRRMEQRLERIEELLRGGPLAGDQAASRIAESTALADSVAEVEHATGRVRQFLQLRKATAAAEAGDLDLLGELTASLQLRLATVEGAIDEAERSSGRREASEGLLLQADQLAKRALEIEHLMEHCAGGDAAPPQRCAQPGSAARAAYLSGLTAGRLRGCAACHVALRRQHAVREQFAVIRTQEEEAEAAAAAQLRALDARYVVLAERAEAAERRGAALDLLHQGLEERGAALRGTAGKEVRAVELARREAQLADQEARLLRLQQAVSQEQLRLRRETAMQEEHHAGAVRRLLHRQVAVEQGEFDAAALERSRLRFERMCKPQQGSDSERAPSPPRAAGPPPAAPRSRAAGGQARRRAHSAEPPSRAARQAAPRPTEPQPPPPPLQPPPLQPPPAPAACCAPSQSASVSPPRRSYSPHPVVADACGGCGGSLWSPQRQRPHSGCGAPCGGGGSFLTALVLRRARGAGNRLDRPSI